jgi:hypothetical protein
MALAYSVDVDQQRVTITGDYSQVDEWARLLNAMVEDPVIRPGFAFLRDLRAATNPVGPTTVVGIIEVVKRLWPKLQPSRAAIVTPRQVDAAALVAVALADAQNLPLRVFQEYDEAIAWLRGGALKPDHIEGTHL